MKNKLLFLFLLLSYSIFSQSKISKQQALEDIAFLLKTSYDIHPDFYAFKDSLEFNDEIKKFDTQNDSITLKEFQFHLRKIVNSLKDGHTFVYLNNYEKVKNGSIKHPIKIIGRELFLAKNPTENLKITTINNIPSSKIYTDLIELISGEFLDYKEKILEDNFLYFFQLLYGKTDSLNIKDEKGQEKYSILSTSKINKTKYSFSAINDTIGVLKLTSFSFRKNEENKFKQFIDNTFNSIKENPKINTLFIDISENDGGNSSYGDYVLSYLTEKPYNAYEYQKLKRSKTSKKYFKKFIKWYLYPIAIFSKEARLVAFKKVGTEELSINPVTPQNKGYLFNGKVYLITSAKTYSAGATMAVAFKNAQIGKIVGQASGQPVRGFIDLIPYHLPNSKLKIATSLKEYRYANGETQSSKIEPDIYI
ncbi:hypothetical protein KRX57_07215, partial [Weeksellaceae bacterium TAE3-ERU29]|nr:hypothetical protein [Weeksellaceae bacterium TAE3-ERU29]